MNRARLSALPKIAVAASLALAASAAFAQSATEAELTTAASFVPWMMTCTLLVVPSADATVNVSDTDWPTFRLS